MTSIQKYYWTSITRPIQSWVSITEIQYLNRLEHKEAGVSEIKYLSIFSIIIIFAFPHLFYYLQIIAQWGQTLGLEISYFYHYHYLYIYHSLLYISQKQCNVLCLVWLSLINILLAINCITQNFALSTSIIFCVC